MRTLAPLLAVLVVILAMPGATAAIGADRWTAPAANAATPAPAAPAVTPTPDDAAKHARRTACLQDAKTKKLVGAQKATFIKDCIAAR